MTSAAEAPERITLLQLLLIHLRVGNLTFGGGDPTLAALHSEIVAGKRWMTPERFGTVFALARITPGTNLLALCAGMAWDLLGWRAAIGAVLAMTVPASIMVVILTHSYAALMANGIARAALAGILAAAVAMMGAAAWLLIRPYLIRKHALHAVVIVGGALALSLWFSMSPIKILGLAAITGLVWRVPE